MGSAITGTILTAHTAAGAEFPANHGYTVGSLVSICLLLVAAVLSWLLPHRHAPAPLTADQELEITEDVNAAISGTITLEEGVETTGRVHA
jgi:hypothetical protein